MIFKWNYMSSN